MEIHPIQTDSQLSLVPGTELNQYTIMSVLGQGTFGITYLAVNTTLNQYVAIKEFLPEPVAMREDSNTVRPKNSNDCLTFQHFKQRFLEEAQNLALFKHQNIVRINGYFEANDTAYMVMDYETGVSLEQHIQQNKETSETQLVSFMKQLSSGLNRLHQAGIIHRDIKPDNIFIREHDNSPVLLDFGSARHALQRKTQDLTTLLTVGYAPIEQYSNKGTKQGPWTDIYSLAAVCYELVTGNRPMESTLRSETKMRTGTDPLPSATQSAEGKYSRAFLQLIDQGLAMLAEDRPQSIQDWQRQFEQLSTRTQIQDIQALQDQLEHTPNAVNHSLNDLTSSRTIIPFPIPTESEVLEASNATSQSPTIAPDLDSIETQTTKPTEPNHTKLTLTITLPSFKMLWAKYASAILLLGFFLIGVTMPIFVSLLTDKLVGEVFVWILFLAIITMALYLISEQPTLSKTEKIFGSSAVALGGIMLITQFIKVF